MHKPIRSWTSTPAVAALGGAIALAALSGCVTRTREVVVERPVPAAPVVVQAPTNQVRTMPGPINEVQGAAPGAGFSWLTGYWAWDGARWAWQPGRWIQGTAPVKPAPQPENMGTAPSPSHYYVPGYWQYSGSAWVWVPGSWRV